MCMHSVCVTEREVVYMCVYVCVYMHGVCMHGVCVREMYICSIIKVFWRKDSSIGELPLVTVNIIVAGRNCPVLTKEY